MMAEGGFEMQNQLKFNLGIPLAASNVAVRYHKPNPIIVERAGGISNIPNPSTHVAPPVDRSVSARSSIAEDRMALAVRLAQRDLKKQREGQPIRKRTPSPKQKTRSKFTKGGTRMVYTKEAEERAERLQQKRASRDPLKVREQGWNSGIGVARTQTPPRDRQARLNMPATTNSPPTRDTDRYPRSAPLEDPNQEIGRLQREMEGYLQQIQVIEQKAMREQSSDAIQPPKSRKKDGYLSDEEDPARRTLRLDEQATRSARQVYNLRQQVRALQDQVTRHGNVKHTKKSQVMLRLAAAHRGAVRAIQGFVNQQLPQQDLRRGLPTGYHELALLIRQLALLSTGIRTNQDTSNVHGDLLRMLDRVDELNKVWCNEQMADHEGDTVDERRRKSPLGRQALPSAAMESNKGRQTFVIQKKTGKENRPKGLLKKHMNRGSKPIQKSHRPRKVTPERQQVLQAGIQALLRDNVASHRQPGVAWDISADDSAITDPANTSLILPKGLQHKREKAQRSVAIAIPDSHFADATVSSHLKTVEPSDTNLSSRDPWKPGGNTSHKSPSRTRSQDRSRSKDRTRSKDRNRSQDRNRSLDRSRSYSPKFQHRNCLVQNMDTELMQELFPEGVDGEGQRGRSASPMSRSHRQRSASPPRSPGSRSRFTAHKMKSRLGRLQQGAQDASMVSERDRELAEINMRRLLANNACQKAEINGDMISDMLLNDLVYDTAEELQSLEDESVVHREATKMQQNPTLENMYQRLEQMELEQQDIRRRWGTLQFEEETESSLVMKSRTIQRPSGPVAMEITRHGPSQSHRVQHSRAYDKEADAPIIFTKSAPLPKFQQRVTPLEYDEDSLVDATIPLPLQRGRYKTKLKMPDTMVREIHSHLEKYERHLKRTSHQAHAKFDPWKLVEEVSDLILGECLREIENELDNIGENIVHQVCKSEFAVPETPAQEVTQELEEDYGREVYWEPSSQSRKEEVRTSQQEVEAVSILRTSGDRSLLQSSMEKSEMKSREKSQRKEVSFKQDDIDFDKSDQILQQNQEEGDDSLYETDRGALFDAADLDLAVDERDVLDSARDGDMLDSVRDSEGDDDKYQYQDTYEDSDDDDDDDDDDDVEEVSPIDSDDLNYSDEDT